MNRDDVLRELAEIEASLSTRVEVWRVIVEPDGTVSGRIYRGSIHRPRSKEDA